MMGGVLVKYRKLFMSTKEKAVKFFKDYASFIVPPLIILPAPIFLLFVTVFDTEEQSSPTNRIQKVESGAYHYLLKDTETGCLYLRSRTLVPLTDEDGKHVCEK